MPSVPLKVERTVYPLKGMWTFDSAQNIPDGASPDMLNFQVFNGYMRKRPGYGRYETGSIFPEFRPTFDFGASAHRDFAVGAASWSHTCAPQTTMLVVCVLGDSALPTATYNGIPMTLVTSVGALGFYVLMDPPSGTHTVALGGAMSASGGLSTSYFGIHNISGSTTHSASGPSSLTTSIPTTHNRTIGLYCVWSNPGTPTVGTNSLFNHSFDAAGKGVALFSSAAFSSPPDALSMTATVSAGADSVGLLVTFFSDVAPITGVFSTQQNNGTRALYATTRLDLFKYNVGTTNWDVQTGGPLTGADHDLFSFDISQNSLVFSQGVDRVQSLPLTGSTYAAINANAKPAKYLTRWNQRLYTAFTVEGGANVPFRVRWPVAADHTDWVGVGSGFIDLTDDVYQIRNVKKLVDTLVVYTEKGIWIATKTGSSAGPANFALQVKDIGLSSPFSLQGINVLHFFLGTDNMYAFDGVKVISIADAVRATMFGQINPGNLATNFGLLLYDSQEYACFVSTSTSPSCDTAWIYNWSRQVIYPWRFAISEFTCGTLHYLDTSVTIAGLVGTIASQTWVIGAFTLTANFPLPILGASDGHIHCICPGILSDDGVPFTCRWTSKDYTAKDIDPSYGNDMITMKDVGFEYVDPGSVFSLQFYFSIDRGSSWTGPFAVTVGGGASGSIGDAMCTAYQATGRRVRFKIENITVNENPQIMSFTPTLELRKQKVA